MYKNFKQSFMNYVGERSGAELAEIYICNERYKYHQQKQINAHEKIKSLVPAENQKLFWKYFDEYEMSESLKAGIVQDKIYIHGLKDGIELQNLFNSMEENPSLKYIGSFVGEYCKNDLQNLEKKHSLIMLYHQSEVLIDIMRAIDVNNILYDKLYSFREKINDYLKTGVDGDELMEIAS